MKNLNLFLLFLVVVVTFTAPPPIQAQVINYPNLVCGMDDPNQSGSYTFPHFPIANDTLKALVIFCNFPSTSGDFDIANSSLLQYWPGTQSQTLPSWADSIICPTTTNVWDRSLTGLFRDASLGKFWLIGDVYPHLYIFENQVDYYADTSRRIGYAVKELLENLDDSINFADYDKFDPNDYDNDNNRHEPDGVVDFIFINFRFTNAHTIDLGSYSGIAKLGGHSSSFGTGVSEITLDGKRIFAGFPGSGCLYEMQNPWDIGIPAHEFGEHYTYGAGHSEKMGSYNINGGGLASAFDREFIGWDNSSAMSSTSNTTFTLRDYFTTGDYVKIPRSTDTIYLENRERRSFYSTNNFRKWKWLSSEPLYPFMPDSGLLIYSKTYHRSFNIQSANGKWNWAKCVNGEYKIDFYSPSFNFFQNGNLNRYTGESTFDLYNRPVKSLGCQTIQSAVNGTVNEMTYMGIKGDSNTCFDIGYNQVYSPWSNPPLNVPNTNDSLTIELTGRNSNGDLTVEVYYTNILGASPSKPQFVSIEENIIDDYTFNAKLVWNKNLEPDLSKYYIYRGVVGSGNSEPQYYEYVDQTVDTTFIDTHLTLYKDGNGTGSCARLLMKYAYRISAVDNTNKVSVMSEKGTIEGYKSPCDLEEAGARPFINITKEEGKVNKDIVDYKLYENYPNPFNPTTVIKYEVPVSSKVVIKIYDQRGKEIQTLVNNYRDKGSYQIEFNAKDLSSGIYYYKIIAGNFVAIRKMLLIK